MIVFVIFQPRSFFGRLFVIVFKVVVNGVLQQLAGGGKHRVTELSTRLVEVAAALESLKDKLDVYLALASSRY